MGFRIRDGTEKEIPFNSIGVNWIAYIPRQMGIGDEYVWLDGPYCPECNVELKWEKSFFGFKYYWLCKRCNAKYPRPKEERHETIKDIENMVYADVFRRDKFNER